MKEKIRWLFALIAVIVMLSVSHKLGELLASSTEKTRQYCVVLDPGHGGSDPGKVGINGVKEKDLNLLIAKKVRETLIKNGIRVAMTREDDTALDSKLEDMKQRVAFINEINPDMAISIHQNSYTDSSVKGAQVFYYVNSEKGQELALLLQEELCKMDTSNRRKAKANESYYMLRKTEVLTVIVECGFLSNQDEAEQLCTEEYQEKVADTICEGIIKGLDKL